MLIEVPSAISRAPADIAERDRDIVMHHRFGPEIDHIIEIRGEIAGTPTPFPAHVLGDSRSAHSEPLRNLALSDSLVSDQSIHHLRTHPRQEVSCEGIANHDITWHITHVVAIQVSGLN